MPNSDTPGAARPIIAVPTQTLQAIDNIPEGLPHSWVMNHRYFLALTQSGAAPFMVPLLEDEGALRALFDAADGVFIAGGVDVDPPSYGAEREPGCGRTDPPRDRVELLLTQWALAEGKPLLGVCRGMQVLNVARGGTLHQDCATDLPDAVKHDYFPTAGYARDHLAHEVTIADGSRMRAIYAAPRVQVNSMHHQAIDRLGDGLAATAHAPDGLIEAVELPGDAFHVAVQWHPEMLVERDAATRRLFASFVEAARSWRASRALGIS